MCDCYPMHCWRVTHFYVFLHICLSAGLAHFLLQAWCRMLGSQVTNKQIGHDALFLELWDCNKGTTHSDTPPVFLQLQSWLCGGMFCKRTIFCVSYMWIDILVSPIIVTMKVWAVTRDVPTTSSRKHLLSSTGPLAPQFPHPFFLTSIETMFMTLWD